MKTKIFKSILPLFAIMLAIGGAFAFNRVPEKVVFTDAAGYIPGTPCTNAEVTCQVEDNHIFCTNLSSVQLWKMNAAGTACPTRLYRKQ